MTHLLEFSLHLVLSLFYILFILLKNFYLFFVTLGLHCCAQVFLELCQVGLLFIVV